MIMHNFDEMLIEFLVSWRIEVVKVERMNEKFTITMFIEIIWAKALGFIQKSIKENPEELCSDYGQSLSLC